jgi:hypothetical protein
MVECKYHSRYQRLSMRQRRALSLKRAPEGCSTETQLADPKTSVTKCPCDVLLLSGLERRKRLRVRNARSGPNYGSILEAVDCIIY